MINSKVSDNNHTDLLMEYSRLHGTKKALKEVLRLINKEIKRCKEFIEEQKGYLKLKEMTNKEWIKGRIEECEYTIEMLQELKTKINGK